MHLHAGFRIAFECAGATPFLLKLNVSPDRRADLLTPDIVQNDRGTPMRLGFDEFGNGVLRLTAPAGRIAFHADFHIQDSGLPDRQATGARQIDVDSLPDTVLPYLMGSRYCETDLLSDLPWSMFSMVSPGCERVQAIVDYVHQRLAFGYPDASPTRTAAQAHGDQVGVCRDFAHLAVTLCRAMNIPARYCNGYLGDIGIPPVDAPMDFSAWFEAYLEGGWHTFDARHNAPRIGRVVIARGRDAADVAMTHAFGAARLVGFAVVAEEVEDGRRAPTGCSGRLAAE